MSLAREVISLVRSALEKNERNTFLHNATFKIEKNQETELGPSG